MRLQSRWNVIRQVDDFISYNSQHTQNERSNNHKSNVFVVYNHETISLAILRAPKVLILLKQDKIRILVLSHLLVPWMSFNHDIHCLNIIVAYSWSVPQFLCLVLRRKVSMNISISGWKSYKRKLFMYYGYYSRLNQKWTVCFSQYNIINDNLISNSKGSVFIHSYFNMAYVTKLHLATPYAYYILHV